MFSIIKDMKKIYCVICGKCRKPEKPKILYEYCRKNILSIT